MIAQKSGEVVLEQGFAIVVDVGKTVSKVSLWSRTGMMVDRQVRSNVVIERDGIRRLDARGIGAWLVSALAAYSAHPVEYIVPVSHGAGVAAIVDGELAFAPLDYEQEIPEETAAAYRVLRDPFALTGSPALPQGLNIGAQLFWLEQLEGAALRSAVLMPWAQYWAWFLSGKAVSEVTSLGCHSDIWCPSSGEFSPLAQNRGWAGRFAPLASAGDVVGNLRPDLATATRLPTNVKILAGLHDSNAALLAARGFAALINREATVLSTGTWFIAMRTPGQSIDWTELPEERDCLVNVDAYAQPVPSARFMGGREIETVIGIDTRRVDIKPDQPALLATVPALLRDEVMMLPTLAPGCGPFPELSARWIGEPADWFARRAAVCLYAALVADVALDLIGSTERLLIEGRFAEAQVFTRALAALRPATQIYTANAHNDVSFGALRLIDPKLQPEGELTQVTALPGDFNRYRDRWRSALEQRS